MIVSTVLGKIISIFMIMLVGVICYRIGIIDNHTRGRMLPGSYPYAGNNTAAFERVKFYGIFEE